MPQLMEAYHVEREVQKNEAGMPMADDKGNPILSDHWIVTTFNMYKADIVEACAKWPLEWFMKRDRADRRAEEANRAQARAAKHASKPTRGSKAEADTAGDPAEGMPITEN